MPERNASFPRFLLVALGLFFAVTAVWWPALLPRLWVADDISVGGLAVQGVASYVDIFWLWRFIGHCTPFILEQINPWLPGFVVVSFLWLGCLLLYKIGVLAFQKKVPAFLVALAFATLPMNFEALMWNACFTYVGSSVGALAIVCLTFHLPLMDQSRKIASLLLLVPLTVVTLFCHEAAFFILSSAPILAFALHWGRAGWKQRPSKKLVTTSAISTAVIFFSQVVWAILYYSTKSQYYQKNIKFNPETLLGGLFHQWKSLHYFEIPFVKDFWSLPFAPVAPLLAGLAVSAVLIGIGIRSQRISEGKEVLKPERGNTLWLLPCLFFLMYEAGIMIYALGGGFSMDSRRQMILWPSLLLLAGSMGCILRSKLRCQFPGATKVVSMAVAVVIITNAVSSSLLALFWRKHAADYHKLVKRMAEEQAADPFQVEWSPDYYAGWGFLEMAIGHRFDTHYSVVHGIAYYLGDDYPAKMVNRNGLFRQDPESGEWHYSAP